MRLLTFAAICFVLGHAVTAAQSPCPWSDVAGGVTAPVGLLGTGAVVDEMTVFDDGTGRALIVAGSFEMAGGVPADGIAKWDGTTWSALGNAVPAPSGTSQIRALTVFDDGTGPALYVGGTVSATAVAGSVVSRWDGTSWSPVGPLGGSQCAALAVFDDGTGPALYAGGKFPALGPTVGVVRWNGSSWSAVGSVLPTQAGLGGVSTLAVLNAALYAGGILNAGGTDTTLARWNGLTWTVIGPSACAYLFPGTTPLNCAGAMDSVVFDDGTGPAVFVTGALPALTASPTPYFHKYQFAGFPITTHQCVGCSVRSPEVFDDGNGPSIYGLTGSGSTLVVSRWNGLSWVPVSGTLTSPSPFLGFLPSALAVFDDGTGPTLYAGGGFTMVGTVLANGIAKWTCPGNLSLSSSQPGGPGSPVYVNNANLTPGNEYFNLFVIGCAAGAGGCAGPYGTNWTPTNINLVNSQLTQPLGTPPFHVTAPSSYINWGPFPGLPPLTLDAICIDFTGGAIGPVSSVVRIVVQ